METVRNPLTLTVMSELEVARKYQASTEDTPDFKEYLPLERAQELDLFVNAARECAPTIHNVDGGHDLLTCVLTIAILKAERIPDTYLLSKILIDHESHINFNAMAMCIRDMRGLDFQTLKFLIQKVDDFIIINNLFLLAVYEADYFFMDLCLDQGADDFDTAQKIATFNLNGDVVQYLVRAHVYGPFSRYRTEEYEIEYGFYYEMSRYYSPQHFPEIKKRARYCIMSALGNSLWHPAAIPDLLDTPMARWSNQSLYTHIVALEINELYDMSFASVYTSDYTPDPSIQTYTDDSEYDSDDSEEDLCEFFHWYMSLS